MLRTILSISGRSGLYRLVSRGRNMLIVESLSEGKRMPAYSRDKVMSLGDIAIYTEGEDRPLGEVLELVKIKTGTEAVDVKALESAGDLRRFFGEVLTDYDRERVHDSDIRKLLQWYNQLIAAGITDFVDQQPETDGEPKQDESEGKKESEN